MTSVKSHRMAPFSHETQDDRTISRNDLNEHPKNSDYPDELKRGGSEGKSAASDRFDLDVQHGGACAETMQRKFFDDGFVLIRNCFDTILLEKWQDFCTKYFVRCFELLHAHGHTPTAQHKQGDKDYSLGLGAKNGFREVVMRSPGRYELSLLYYPTLEDASEVANVDDVPPIPRFNELLEHSVLGTIIPKLFGKESSIQDLKLCHLSLLVATPGSTDQSWHADGGHLNITEHLPCHCLNIFIPLHDVPLEMGPTEFRPGSHYLTRDLARMLLAAKCRKTLRAPVWEPLNFGDAVVFDYRCLHRGRANTDALRNRNVLVLTYSQPFFKDICNFPKRTMMTPAETAASQPTTEASSS